MNSGFAKYVAKRLLRTRHDGVKVYLAVQRGFGRDIELRIIDGGVPERSEEYLRFCREVKILAQLDHPNILKVLDFGRAGTRIWYTTEYRNAVPLQDLLLRVGGPLTRDEVLEVGRAVGGALGHIHAQGQIHRDVNGQSIFYDFDSKLPFVAEFALLKDLSKYQITRRGDAAVLTRILTPELVMAQPYTAATDLFMLGALLYHLATARNPLEQAGSGVGSDVTELFRFPPPSSVNPDIPGWLDAAIMRLLAPKPSDRPASAAEFLEGLTTAAAPLGENSSIDTERGEILAALQQDVATPVDDGGESLDWDDIDDADAHSVHDGSVPDGPAETAEPEKPSPPAVPEPRADPTSSMADTQPVKAARERSTAQPLAAAPARLPLAAAIAGAALLVVAVVLVVLPSDSSTPPRPTPEVTTSVEPIGDDPVGTDGPVRPAGPVTKEEEAVLEVADGLSTSPVTKDNFIKRLKVLKDYALSLSDKDRNRIMPYKRIMAIKVEYYRHADKACERLTTAFLEVRDIVKGR